MKVTAAKQLTVSKWTWMTFAGWITGVFLILLLSSCLDVMGIENMQFYLGIGMGAGVGFMQWLLLRRKIAMSQSWIWVSVLGMGFPLVVLDMLRSVPATYKLPGGIAAETLIAGYFQSRLLKKYTGKTGYWIPGCVLGWTLAVGCVFIIDYTHHLKTVISSNLLMALVNLLLILAGGIVLGLITGWTLSKIRITERPQRNV